MTVKGPSMDGSIKYALYRLQTIRLRYRLCHFADYGEVKLSLGFKLVVSVGIELCKISEAGTDGLVDLFTCWFDRGKPIVHDDRESKSIYGKRTTVSPTVLLYQLDLSRICP